MAAAPARAPADPSMSHPARAEPEPLDPAAYVERVLASARHANALSVAWLRIAVRAFTVVAYGAGVALGARIQGPSAVQVLAISTLHLAFGVAVLALLRHRPTETVIAAGATSDFVTVFAGAWLGVSSPGADPTFVAAAFVAVFQLILLFTTLTLPGRFLGPLAAAACVLQGIVAWRAGLSIPDGALLVAILTASSVAITWAGAHLVAMATRAAREALASQAARRHAGELARANRALEAARAQAQLLTALVVHDLRNPLASALANLEAVGDEVRDPATPAGEALEVATGELHRLTGMIGDLLLVSRIEEGLRAVPRPVRVDGLVQSVARSTGAAAARAGASLAVRVPEGLTAALDEPMARRLLENLVANAVRHVGPGDRIELAAEVEGGLLRLAVRNSGPPVSPEARTRLFEKHSTHGRRAWHNAGLGLHLCRLVAEGHGGRIGLVERPGWNVSFEAELPLAGGV